MDAPRKVKDSAVCATTYGHFVWKLYSAWEVIEDNSIEHRCELQLDKELIYLIATNGASYICIKGLPGDCGACDDPWETLNNGQIIAQINYLTLRFDSKEDYLAWRKDSKHYVSEEWKK